MRRLVLATVLVAGCSSSPSSSGDSPTGEIALSNSSPVLPANEAHGQAAATFSNRSLDARVCRSLATFGACTVHSSCEADDTPVTHASAGEITIGAYYTFTPDPDGLYGSHGYSDDRIFAPSTPIALHAAGDEIPAFALALVSPESLSVVAPSRTTTAFSRARDLEVTWTGLTTGTAAVTISDGLEHASTIECAFAGPSGAGTIPAAALAAFGGSAGTLTIASKTATSTAAGAWNVTFEVTDDAAWGDGATGPLALTFHD